MNRTETHRQRRHLSLGVLVAGVCAAPCMAQALIGSGAHLLLPVPNPATPAYVSAPTLGAIVPNVSFTGTFAAPAPAAWLGTFTATGPVPSSANAGVTTYNFSALAQGSLPGGTVMLFGDVDGGSGSGEQIMLKAFDVLNNVIVTPWMDRMITAWGTGGAGGAPTLADMPGWTYNTTTGTYVIDGSTQSSFGNPTISFALVTNMRILRLEVNKPMTNCAFGLAAPLTCYANCDGSTVAPVLNAGDFACFLQKFQLGCP